MLVYKVSMYTQSMVLCICHLCVFFFILWCFFLLFFCIYYLYYIHNIYGLFVFIFCVEIYAYIKSLWTDAGAYLGIICTSPILGQKGLNWPKNQHFQLFFWNGTFLLFTIPSLICYILWTLCLPAFNAGTCSLVLLY